MISHFREIIRGCFSLRGKKEFFQFPIFAIFQFSSQIALEKGVNLLNDFALRSECRPFINNFIPKLPAINRNHLAPCTHTDLLSSLLLGQLIKQVKLVFEGFLLITKVLNLFIVKPGDELVEVEDLGNFQQINPLLLRIKIFWPFFQIDLIYVDLRSNQSTELHKMRLLQLALDRYCH